MRLQAPPENVGSSPTSTTDLLPGPATWGADHTLPLPDSTKDNTMDRFDDAYVTQISQEVRTIVDNLGIEGAEIAVEERDGTSNAPIITFQSEEDAIRFHNYIQHSMSSFTANYITEKEHRQLSPGTIIDDDHNFDTSYYPIRPMVVLPRFLAW
jgi:hypothetical protein